MIEKWCDDQVFTGKSYSGQKLTQTEFDTCSFQNCDFSNADLTDSDFVNCRFDNCNFALAKMTDSGMKNVHFVECKLVGLNFNTCSDFQFSVEFRKCMLDFSSFAEKKMKKTKFTDCSLKEVDFTMADLSMAIFHNCDIFRAFFKLTNLEKADFRTAINYSFDPESNKIKKAKFSYSGISGLLSKYNIDLE